MDLEQRRFGWRRADPAWLGLVLVVLVLAGLRGGWALDDRELVLENPLVRGELPWWRAFDRDYFHHLGGAGQWRPLATLSLRLDHALYGATSTGYHVTNALLQLAVAALLLPWLHGAARARAAVLAGSCAFALHPALCDAFGWIAGRTSMLSALGPLAAAAWLARRERAPAPAALVAGAGLLCGLLGKEDALVLAPLVWWSAGPRRRAASLGLAAAALLAFVGRWCALGGPLVGATTPALVGAPLLERLQVGSAALTEALRLALWPRDFPPLYDARLLAARVGELWPLGGAFAASVLIAALCAPRALLRAEHPPARAWALGALLAFLPVAQLVPIGEVFAPRFLYLPLLYAAPLVALACDRVRPPRLRALCAAAVCLACAGGTLARAEVWVDRGSLRREQLRHAPDDAASWNNLGLHHEERGELDAARAAWTRATEVDPRYSKAWSNLGRLAFAAGDLDAAEAAWTRALAEGPRNAVAHVNLASLRLRRADARGAAELYARAVELAPGLAAGWRGLAQARLALGELDAADAALARALALAPRDPAARALERRLRDAR